MKILAALLVVALILGIAYAVVTLYLQHRQRHERNEQAWQNYEVVPRNLGDGITGIYLERPGHPDFLYRELGPLHTPTELDSAMMEAEIVAKDWNRMRKDLRKEIH